MFGVTITSNKISRLLSSNINENTYSFKETGLSVTWCFTLHWERKIQGIRSMHRERFWNNQDLIGNYRKRTIKITQIIYGNNIYFRILSATFIKKNLFTCFFKCLPSVTNFLNDLIICNACRRFYLINQLPSITPVNSNNLLAIHFIFTFKIYPPFPQLVF